MGGPSIEAGWSEMSDGLHIQRHFLEIVPTLRRRVAGLYEARPGLPPLAELEPLGTALLEHLLHPAQPLPPTEWSRIHRDEITTGLAGASLLLVDSPACTSEGVVDFRALPQRARSLGAAVGDEVDAALQAASLAFIVQLNVGVIVERAGHEPELEYDPAAEPVGTVVLRPGRSAWRYAEDLAARASAQWLHAFAWARPHPLPPVTRAWQAAWLSRPVDTTTLGAEILARSVRLRLRERLLARAPELLGSERDECARSVAELAAQLAPHERFVDDLERHLAPEHPPADLDPDNEMDVADLLCTFYPGPRQFHKYWRGGGAGQAE